MAIPKECIPLEKLDEVLIILNKISIFGGLTSAQLEFIFTLLEKVRYNEGEFIFKKGEDPSYIYIVESGSVELALGENGHFLAKTVFTVGQCFGETSIIGIQPHSAHTIAKEACDLIILSRKALMSIFNQDKDLFGMLILNIAREACRRLAQADEVLLHYFHDNL